MKKILFFMCIAIGSYAQSTKLEDLTPKTYTVEKTGENSYDVTDQKTLKTKRYDVNKSFGTTVDVTETTLYGGSKAKKAETKKGTGLYDNVDWYGSKKKKEEN
jgi:hypothetical protein